MRKDHEKRGKDTRKEGLCSRESIRQRGFKILKWIIF